MKKIITKIMNNMRKTLLMAALVLISAGCMAQKANVNKAKSLILSETPDYDQARQLIGAALANDETKNQANTWYVAGLIGYQQNVQANRMALLNQPLDQDQVGQAIMESYDYWVKADEIAMTPTLDKKGREVVDTKTRNNIVKKMLEYYQNQEFIKYGVHLNEQRDFKGAYNVFMRHLKMRDLPMMQEDKLQSQMPKDTIYEQYEYYAALFAIQAKMHNEAIAVLEDLKKGEFEAIAVNQFLYQEYMEEVKDTVNAVRELQEAMVRFPQEPWFLQNLINYYIFSKQEDKAIEYLNQAIEREPGVAEYHLIKGNLSANQGNNAEALTEYDQALEINPMLAEAHAGKGRVHYNEASKIIEEATYIQDAKAYKAALNKASDKLKESLPFFEKALEVAPDNREYMVILKGIYYRLHMDDKYEAMQDMLNN
jgi:tetratricopeptide (TPR) repeat protein